MMFKVIKSNVSRPQFSAEFTNHIYNFKSIFFGHILAVQTPILSIVLLCLICSQQKEYIWTTVLHFKDNNNYRILT